MVCYISVAAERFEFVRALFKGDSTTSPSDNDYDEDGSLSPGLTPHLFIHFLVFLHNSHNNIIFC